MPCRACGRLITFHTFTRQLACAEALDPEAVLRATRTLEAVSKAADRPAAERAFRESITTITTGA